MQWLKNALILLIVLALRNSASHLALDTDARDTRVGCVFLQEQPDMTVKPIGYRPRSLTDS